MKLLWEESAWADYLFWLSANPSAQKRINALIKDTLRTPFEGLGKPEPLKGNLSGFWSRRITEKDRLVYCVRDDTLIIAACKGHYE